jgi:N-6 DNA Methylase
VPHPIAQQLYKIQATTGDNFFKLWDDWLGLAVAALSKHTEADEEKYMAIMRKYGPRVLGKDHPADYFSHALGAFMHACRTESALNGTFPDYLGMIYEQESLTNRYSGQFFTPEHLCKLMVQMTVEPTQELISIADPACGSGRFFIAAQPIAPNATFYGTDRDLTCVHMTAMNMLMRNANAVIVHGNTLSLECFGGYVTRSTILGGVIRPLDAIQAKSVLVKTVETIAAKQESGLHPHNLTQPAPAAEVSPAPIFVTNKKGQMGFDF